jgi:hypothetical protein
VTVPATGVAADIVSAGAVTFDGSPVLIEFYAAAASPGAGANCTLHLFDGATDLGYIAQFYNGGAGTILFPVFVTRKITPSAGSHTFKITGISGGATCGIAAGPGAASGDYQPAYIRVSRA